MKRCLLPLLFLPFLATSQLLAAEADSTSLARYPLVLPHTKASPWVAAASPIGWNAIYWSASKFLAKKEFANISWTTMRNNLRTGFIWDNDEFPTNLVAHPYQGGLYYTAARGAGLTALESLPYAIVGSAVWELLLENEPASLNDILTTPLGGMLYGEILHRVSASMVDRSTTGFGRVVREGGAFLLNPSQGILRLSTGDLWRVGPEPNRGKLPPLTLTLGGGYRSINSLNNYQLQVGIDYGSPFAASGRIPFEYFTLDAALNLIGEQPNLSNIRISALLFVYTPELKEGSSLLLGAFQQFHYYNTETKVGEIPYRMNESVSYGFGLRHEKRLGRVTSVKSRLNVNGVALGAYLTDYYRFGKRDYTFGSGYSMQGGVSLVLANRVTLSSSYELYHLFASGGWEHKDYENTSHLYLNAQGDPGSALLQRASAALSVRLFANLSLSSEFEWYRRHNSYRLHPTTARSTQAYSVALSWRF